MTRWSPALAAAVMLAAGGCGAPANDAPPADDPAGDAAAAADTAPAAQGDPTGDDDRAVCLQGGPFVADGDVPLEAGAGGDADRIAGLRFERHEGCARFVVDLETEDGEPAATAGAVDVQVVRELGVVRLELRDVEWVEPAATEASFDGRLASDAYAIWSPEGRWMRVDLHLADPAEAAALALADPARVLVDLRPGGPALPPPATVGERVVVLEPRPGAAAYPLTVTGYARTFEANVVLRLEQDGELAHETFTTATAWADAWGHFSFTVRDGPSGRVRLHVGEHSARDGTWEGVAVPLEMR